MLGISVDSWYALRAWKAQQGFRHRLLSDRLPLGAVARFYGVWNAERGYANPGTFILDRDGVVRYRVVNPPGEARDASDYVAALGAIGWSGASRRSGRLRRSSASAR